jgi:hypothetical protein
MSKKVTVQNPYNISHPKKYGGFNQMKWEYVKTEVEGNCQLFGVNLFDYEWEDTHSRIKVKDPAYRQEHMITIFRVKIEDKFYTFAAGEFSNCIWGFYLPI